MAIKENDYDPINDINIVKEEDLIGLAGLKVDTFKAWVKWMPCC